MAAIAPNTEKLRELEEGTARAWGEYSARLRDLNGEEYEHAERESWAKLQTELRRLERRRETLNQTST